ncbi:MAG: glutamine synthetase family protein [Candidatus Krumholzibacteriales bacterium]
MDILKRVKEDGVQFVELEFSDIFGTLKSLEIPVSALAAALERGIWFDGSSIRGYARIKESDMFLKPDIDTYSMLPADNEDMKTARFMCDIFKPDGTVFEGDPRAILKKQVREAADMGYLFNVGPEVEFFLFKKSADGSIATPDFDTGSYFDSSEKDLGSDIRKEIMSTLKFFGIDSERAHHEVGAGQHEVGFKYGDALSTADTVVLLKKIIKSTAHEYGLIASFMPKPIFGKPGNGMHIHSSLFSLDGAPLFFDENDDNNLSALARYFIAGLLKYINEIVSLTNPTINSYKRLNSGFEAPKYICWGSKNRSSLIRIPQSSPGRRSSVRAELRCPDPSASPYLAFAAILKAGLEGIKRELELPHPMQESVYIKSDEELAELDIEMLPGSLREALSNLEKSSIMEELLGEEFLRKYIQAKRCELDEFDMAVTDWEQKRYLDRC